MPHISGAGKGYAIDKYKIEYLPLIGYSSWSSPAVATSDATLSAGQMVASVGTADTAAATFVEVGTSGIAGCRFTYTDSDIGILWPTPYDLDVKSPVELAVVWSSDQTTATDTITWKVLYTELTMDTTAVAIGATALNTAIAADTNIATANALQQTAYGQINGGLLTNGRVLSLILELDAVSGATTSSDVIVAYYLVVRYVRRRL